MDVFLDGERIETTADTLAVAIDAARASAGSRIIIEIDADGMPVPPEHLAEPPADEPYATELHVRSADPRLVAAESLREAGDALTTAAPLHEQAAEQIQRGETEAAMQTLGAVLTPWNDAMRTVSLIRDLHAEGLITDEVAPEDLGRRVSELHERLSAVRTALEQQDWPDLGDILGYDLPPLAGQWNALLAELADALTPDPA